MAELSIKIKLAGREYPMKVKSEDEERIRRAGKELEEKIKTYRDQFSIDDKQDLLAMVAFDSYMEKLKALDQEQDSGIDENLAGKLKGLSDIISNSL